MDRTYQRKIGIIAWERFSYGGVSRVVSALISNLSNFYDVKVLCLKKEKFFQNVYGIDTGRVEFSFMEMTLFQKIRREYVNRIYWKGKFSKEFWMKNFIRLKYSRFYLKRIAKWINENEFDVVIFASGFEDSIQLAAIQPMLKYNPKLISWSHGGFRYYFGNDTDSVTHRVWKKYYDRFDRIVVLSDADIEECNRQLGLNSVRIYNPNSFIPKKRTNLNNKKFLYLGALSDAKGSDILIEAFIEFAKTNTTWNLEIYGEGAISAMMHNRIIENHLQDRVTIHPYTLDVENTMAQHDVFILPSRFEGFGIVQIEAASCGLPLIASDVAICKELIAKYNHGVLFKRLDSHSLAEQMHYMAGCNLKIYSDNAFKAAEDFTSEKIFNEWRIMIDSLINETANE